MIVYAFDISHYKKIDINNFNQVDPIRLNDERIFITKDVYLKFKDTLDLEISKIPDFTFEEIDITNDDIWNPPEDEEVLS